MMCIPEMRKLFQKMRIFDELGLSFVIAKEKIKVLDMPSEVHGNLIGNNGEVRQFGSIDPSLCIHYHENWRLENSGLGHYII